MAPFPDELATPLGVHLNDAEVLTGAGVYSGVEIVSAAILFKSHIASPFSTVTVCILQCETQTVMTANGLGMQD